jgi:ABC-type lipoprotein release transport system permease subunit
MIDITEKKLFTLLSAFCIVFGVFIGIATNMVFYAASHMMIATGGYVEGTQIPPFWGVVFILIMAATAFAIALTARLAPGWVAYYIQNHEVPPGVVSIIARISWIKNEIDKSLEPEETE